MTADRQPPRNILITGASSGLGAALARHYAAAGTRLSLTGRNRDRLEAVAKACRAGAVEVETAILDVSDSVAMSEWLQMRDEAGPFDLVFANAGIGGIGALASPAGESLEAARRMFTVNTLGVVNTIAPLAPRMCERRRGHFVIISSVASMIALPHSPAYCGSKAAVTTYGEAMRRLLAPAGVKVTVVHPGFVDTPMSATLPYKPFLWTAERAAAHIAAGVERGRRNMAFPWPFRIAVAAARVLPASWVDAVLARSMRLAE